MFDYNKQLFTFVQVKRTTQMDRQIRVSLSEHEQNELLQLTAELCSGGIVSSRDFDHVIGALQSARNKAFEVGPDWNIQQGDLNEVELCA